MPRKTSEAGRAAIPVHPGGGTASGQPGEAGDLETGARTVPDEVVVRSYLTQLLGPERADAAASSALAELARITSDQGGRPPAATTVRRVAQSAGFDALDAQVHAVGRRLARGPKCASVVRHLRGRAEGQISAADLASFYSHVDRCLNCAQVVGRFQTSEWYLQVNLGSSTPRGSSGSGTAPGPEARPRENGRLKAAPMSSDATAPEPAAATAAVAAREPTARRRRRLRRVAVAGIVAAGVVIFAALLALKPSTVSDGGNRAAQVGTTDLSPTYATGPPFVVAGARFAVFTDPQQRWTAFAKSVSPGAGRRWLLVTVSVRNLTRPHLDPAKLGYRLIGPGGVSYLPNRVYGSGPQLHGPARPIAPGTLAQTETAFQVPVAATGLKLAFDAGPNEQVVIPLGR